MVIYSGRMAAVRRKVTNRGTGAAGHLGIELAEYDARIRTFIPGYERMIEIASLALQLTVRRRAPLIVDLGIGTGALSAACVRCIPGARVIGIDEDDGMLAAARERLGRALTRTIHASFETADLPPCDAVVASLALHHVPTPARRQRLFRRIHRALRHGGMLVSADCHPESHPRLAAFGRLAWLAHLEETYSPAVARGYLRAWAREDHYVRLVDELAALRRAGFSVDVPARKETWAVIAARVQ